MKRELQLERLNQYVEQLEVANSYTDLAKNTLAIVKDESIADLTDYLENVSTYGCVSGYVGALVYYADTKKFFIENMDDIFSLLQEQTEEFGESPLTGKELDSNLLAWYGFEEMCRKFINELEEE